MNDIIELYPAQEEGRIARKYRIRRIITAAVGASAFIACVVCCFLTGTANAAAMELVVCLISAVGGCLVIFLYVHLVSGLKREVAHEKNLEGQERRTVTGTVRLDSRRIGIRGSITVQTLLIEDGEKTHRVHIYAKKTGLLPALPAKLTVYTVHGYAVAYREVHDEAR